MSEKVSSAQSTSSGLFAGCKRRRVEPTSVSAQLASYIALCDEFDESNVLTFWSANRSRLSKLFPLAVWVLSVTACSASVERVLSYGWLIMHPHRSRLSDKMWSNLIFLKCNSIGEKDQLTQAWSVVMLNRCNIMLMLAASHMILSNFTFYWKTVMYFYLCDLLCFNKSLVANLLQVATVAWFNIDRWQAVSGSCIIARAAG